MQRPRNIVLMIADGMGVSHLAGARSLHVAPLWIDRMPVSGLQSTLAYGGVVTDSAAAATAISTGSKTVNGAIGVDPDARPLPTLIDIATSHGLDAGIVTDSFLWDATPAAFVSHVASRNQYGAILEQMAGSAARVMIGSSLSPENPADSAASDLVSIFRSRGMSVSTSWAEFRPKDSGSLVALLPGLGDQTTDADRPNLSSLAVGALAALQGPENGFFLMIETEQVDSRSHDHDFEGAMRGLLEFDATVGHVLAYARRDGRTLVIVTSDHETGGPDLERVDGGNALSVRWATSGHTAAPVPIYAYGPGAELFEGRLDNSDIGLRLSGLLTRLAGSQLAGVAAAPAP